MLAYYPALHGARLWDDDAHLTRPELRSLAGLARIWFEIGATQQYYPVLHSAFWLEHRLWGDATFGYHLLNVLLHATSAGLIVILMRRLAIPGAWLAGFVFALHPVAVESVAWISEQKNTLSTVFYLLAALGYLRFEETRNSAVTPSDGHRAWRYYALACGLFLLAVLTKSVTVTLPAALLVLAWWRRGRLHWRTDVVPLLPWFAIGIAVGLLTVWVERRFIGAAGADYELGWLERGLLAGRIVWFYLGKLLWPAELMFIYPRWTIDVTSIWQYTGTIAVIVALVVFWRMRHRTRAPLAAALYFGGTLFPALGFFNVYPFVYSYVADHFQYLASLGVIVLFAAIFTRFRERWPQIPARLPAVVATGLVLTLGLLTWRQAHEYRDNITLYRATLAKNPACWMAAYNLGLELVARGETAAAIASYEEALRLRPGYAEVHANLAMALLGTPERLTEVIHHLETSLRLKPDLWQARVNLGNVLLNVPGRLDEALRHYWQVAIQKPDVAWVRCNLGFALQRYPARQAAALKQFRIALELQPEYWEAHYSIATILRELPDHAPAAILHYEAALRLKPDFADAHFQLARLLLRTPGRRADALRHLQTAHHLDPARDEARWMLETLR